MNKLETNVLILGKSGVGKSSFINYIYGKNIREIGAGKPVTKKGLYKVTHEVEDIIVNIYDTWGLEANKTIDWKEIVLDEVKKHNEQISIKDWFHTIYYCFSASTARIEDFEIEEILKPLIKDNNKVTLIITHCDVPGAEEKSKGMIEKILKELPINELDIIKVCSERKKLLGGKIVEPFGKEKVLERLKSNLWNDIKIKIPIQYELYIINEIEEWRKAIQIEIDNEKIYKFEEIYEFDVDRICEYINKSLEHVLLNIDKITNQYLADTYTYYINLVKYIDINLIEVEDSVHHSNFEIDDNIKKLDYWTTGVGLGLRFLGVGGIVVGFAADGLKKIYITKKIVESLDVKYDELLQQVPNLRRKLETFMDTIDM